MPNRSRPGVAPTTWRVVLARTIIRWRAATRCAPRDVAGTRNVARNPPRGPVRNLTRVGVPSNRIAPPRLGSSPVPRTVTREPTVADVGDTVILAVEAAAPPGPAAIDVTVTRATTT